MLDGKRETHVRYGIGSNVGETDDGIQSDAIWTGDRVVRRPNPDSTLDKVSRSKEQANRRTPSVQEWI